MNKLLSILVVSCLVWVNIASADGALGQHFYVAFPKNYNTTGQPTLYLATEVATSVRIQVPSINLDETLALDAETVTPYLLPQAVGRLGMGEVKSLGIEVSANADILVSGMNVERYTTDGYLALPTTALGNEYRIASYYPLNRNNWTLESEFALVATEDNTVVQIIPSVDINDNFPAGVLQQITLNRGETFQLGTYQQDVTGTHLMASKPIAAYGAHECADVPDREQRIGWCDHLVETLLPVSQWGYEYSIVPLATRLAGDVYRVLAAFDQTDVFVNNQLATTLSAGEFFEGEIVGPTQVVASQPIQVMQYAMGQGADGVAADPFMMTLIPFQQFMSDYRFTTPSEGFADNYVNVVIAPGSSLQLDGQVVDTANFSAIPGSNLLAGQLPLTIGTHQLTGDQPFGAYVYGFNAYDSYGYPVGMDVQTITPRQDSFSPAIGELRHIGHRLVGWLNDNEDINTNGVLDPSEDINGNGELDGRTEDINGNGILDAGEDLNGNGLIDRDFGLYTFSLENSSNVVVDVLQTTTSRFPTQQIAISLIDPLQPGNGTLVVEDLNGNRAEQIFDLPIESAMIDVEVISRVSGDRIVVDTNSFNVLPAQVTPTNNGVDILWQFDTLFSNSLQDLTYSVTLQNPIENEVRLVTQSLVVSYVNQPNGERKIIELGPQQVTVSSTAFALALTASDSTIGPNQGVDFIATLDNLTESTMSADLTLVIIDAQNRTLAQTVIPVSNVPAGATAQLPWQWDASGQFTGQYRAIATLVREGQTINESEFQFQIVRGDENSLPTQIDLVIGEDAGNGMILPKTQFFPHESLPIDIQIENITENQALSSGTVTIEITNAQSDLVYENTLTIGTLTPGSLTRVSESIPLNSFAPGVYQAEVNLHDANGELVGRDSYSFTVISTTLGTIEGSVSAAYSELLRGDAQQCNVNLTNLDGSNSQTATIRIAIVDMAAQSVAAETIRSENLSAGGSLSFSNSLAATGVGEGNYACVLTLIDDGNEQVLDIGVFKIYNVIAVPGPAQTLNVGDTLLLDAAGSREADGNPLTYQWQLLEKPDNTLIEIVDNSQPQQSFVMDQQGLYRFELVASNGSEVSLPNTVDITIANRLPVVNAGADQLVSVGETVQLNGLSSTDIDNDLLEYEWSFVQRPDGSSAELTDPSTGTPSFIVDVTGTYLVRLTVTDDAGGVATDDVLLSVDNVPPVANAGVDIVAASGDVVTLDGSGSSDVNGDELSFAWVLIERPAGSSATLTNSAGVRPSFTIDTVGNYTARLIVNDGQYSSSADTVTVFVGNAIPEANAGPDQIILPPQTVFLDGSQSFDLDGDNLQYEWSILSTPRFWYRPSLQNANSATPSFYAYYAGDYVVQLRVNDGSGWSAPDTVVLTTDNLAPEADIDLFFGDSVFYTGDEVRLFGSYFDANGDFVTYHWEIIEKPAGSQATFDRPNDSDPAFVIDEPGDYVVQLIVNDGQLDSDPETFYISGAEACVEDLDIRAKNSLIQLTWTHQPETLWVDIYRSLSYDGEYDWIGETDNTYSVFIDENVVNDTRYYYRFERTLEQGSGFDYIQCMNGPGDGSIDYCNEVSNGEYCEYGEEGDYYCQGGQFGEWDYCWWGEIGFTCEGGGFPPIDGGDECYWDGEIYICEPLNYQISCESQIIASAPARRARYNLVPDVRGSTLETVASQLQASGFQLGEVIEVRTTAFPEGQVIDQDAPRNSRLPRNTAINVYIAIW